MSARTWHKGPPPHVGWWLARPFLSRDGGLWRWWNGEYWSVGAGDTAGAVVIESAASIPSAWPTNELEWTDYWPENARVPRIDPNEVKS
ncbi:hypothetical protein PCA20602_02690 [Pandoraea capi]|uniref:DUF2510 domain-containing protein n=1 Tax=Pandoraea capi TaxID=2508286 RepID=A0ABY6W369_9BURK|nr:hypothetical protein [Pandoraea capi]VVE12169.1 hypothetical protein PCA20602_02690 [Pandoraea capi]